MNVQKNTPSIAAPDLVSLPAGTFLREHLTRYYSGNISKSTLRRWIAQGRLPQPRKLTERTYVWLAGELREALAKLTSNGEV